jgi:hypothetical protein
LEERRTRRKLQLLYNIQNGSTPSYLLDLIPNNWSFLLVLLSSNLSQPVSLYRYSVLVKIGSPVIILAASNCSLSNFSTNFYFYFDGKLIPLTSDHKHLGITFSEEAKWNKHVVCYRFGYYIIIGAFS